VEISEAITAVFTKYTVFTGRSGRPEFWWWILFQIGVRVAIAIVRLVVGPLAGALLLLWALATFIPGMAVSVRRLHDINRSGWWVLLSLVPILGWLVLLYWYCQPSTPGPNQYDL